MKCHMRVKRTVPAAIAAAALLAPAATSASAPPENPNATGQCASATAKERQGRPEVPSFSFPFECPPPPGQRR